MRSRLPAVSLVLFLALALPSAAGAAHGHRLMPRGATAKRQAVQGFWNADRLRSAKPKVLRHAARRGVPSALRRGRVATGPPTVVHSRPPLRSSPVRRRSTLIPDPSVYPYVTNGKLFTSFGRDVFQCSGTLINTKNQRIVLTAGHCIREGEGRFGDW